MQLGIDQLADYLTQHHRGARIGLLSHRPSRTQAGIPAIPLLATNAAWTLTTLFGPEHGGAGRAADMEGVATTREPSTGLPLYSLYGDSLASLRPTTTMLNNLDCLVIDLQDIGTRYYTYIYTMAYCLEACAAAGKPVIVCDRPNPLNGVSIEGRVVEPGFASFVGQYPLPNRHGMTIGELARYFNAAYRIGASLEVIPLHGWQRDWYWEDTKLPWINPSPNMRSPTAALLYPGLCLLEATNISEGRGTATPFEICGAPWIDGEVLANKLRYLHLPGIAFTPITFTPEHRKFSGQRCGGIRLTITDRSAFRPYAFGLALLWTVASLHVATENPKEFGWRTPAGNPPHSGLDAGPYEFVTDRPAIDLLTGSRAVRNGIDHEMPWLLLQHLAGPTPDEFLQQRQRFLLY